MAFRFHYSDIEHLDFRTILPRNSIPSFGFDLHEHVVVVLYFKYEIEGSSTKFLRQHLAL